MGEIPGDKDTASTSFTTNRDTPYLKTIFELIAVGRGAVPPRMGYLGTVDRRLPDRGPRARWGAREVQRASWTSQVTPKAANRLLPVLPDIPRGSAKITARGNAGRPIGRRRCSRLLLSSSTGEPAATGGSGDAFTARGSRLIANTGQTVPQS